MALSLTLNNGTLYTRGHIAVATTWALGLCCALAREVQGHISVARPHHSRFLLVAVALDLEVDVEVRANYLDQLGESDGRAQRAAGIERGTGESGEISMSARA